MKLTIIYHNGLTQGVKPLFDEFTRQGAKVSVIVPSQIQIHNTYLKGGFLSVKEKDLTANYKVIPVDLINIHNYNLGFYPLSLIKAIRATKPDIIQVLNEYYSICTAQAVLIRNISFKETPIATYSFENTGIPKTFLHRLARIPVSAYNRKYINAITGANNEAIEQVKKFNLRIPVKRIFWGVDIRHFYRKDQAICRRTIGIDEDIKLAGYFGRIVEEKGLDRLCQAINKNSKYHLMLVGSGDYKGKLLKYIDYLGIGQRIHFYDSVENDKLVDYYNALNVFVLPSQTRSYWKEQYGRVLIEAMACDIPIIGSSSGAIPEVLDGYPRHLIFREESVEDLVEKLKKAEELKIPDGFKLQDFLRRFGVENFVASHLELYEQLLKERTHG